MNLGASGAADFDLDAFIGREIACSIELEGEAPRQINALITDAGLWGEEGRHVQYKLTLRPWLHLATLRTDCKVFQDKTPIDILDELLGSYAFPVDKRLFDTYPVHDYQTQFNESDFQFFERLCQEWGISYHFEHARDKHRLVLCDAMGAYAAQASRAHRRVAYHAPGWKLDGEYISSFVPSTQLTSGRYATSDHDYTRPRADLSVGRRDPRPTAQADGEVYQWHHATSGSHFAQPQAGGAETDDPREEGRHLALLRMQALRTHGARAQASGALRGMVPGFTFELAGHPHMAANTEYLVLQTRLLIEDVAADSQNKEALERKQQWRVNVDFTAHPANEPLRPAATRRKPVCEGPQTALVVGPEGQNLWTDALGRIKVQFPWDRVGQKNARSSCWVRVSSPWAGNQLGATHVPRIGQEVVVSFVGGDPDLPLCTGRVHDQSNQPPWALPGQSGLSGFRSRALTNEGGNSAMGTSNHLLLDDTDGEMQAQLKSDHRSTSLSLGFITRVEDNAGRKDPRGEGFELRTDGHGVARAGNGMLLTTEARGNAANHANDMSETVQRLHAAQDQHAARAEAAQVHQAQDRGGDQDEVSKALQAQNDAIQGEQEPHARGGFPELSEPHLVLASPEGIQASTPGSVHLHAGAHAAFTSESHTSISSAGRWLASAARGIRAFTHRKGIKLVASDGPVEVQAHKDELILLAHKDLEIKSIDGQLRITARKKVVIIGGGSYSEWSTDGIKHGTAGTWQEHAALHAQVGPTSRVETFPEFEQAQFTAGPCEARYQLFKTDNRPFEQYHYEIHEHGPDTRHEGRTSADGRTRIATSDQPVALKAFKSVMRESERITENWAAVLDARSREADAQSTPASAGSAASESEAA